MTHRVITLSDVMIHNKIDEKDKLIFFVHFDNTEPDIPFDWHEECAPSTELEVHFTFSHIIDELIDWHGFSPEEEGIWFHRDQKKLVKLCRQDLQKCLDRLNEIQFLEEEL